MGHPVLGQIGYNCATGAFAKELHGVVGVQVDHISNLRHSERLLKVPNHKTDHLVHAVVAQLGADRLRLRFGGGESQRSQPGLDL